jgi:hypothetical protein
VSTLPSPLADPRPWDAPRIAGVSWTGGLKIGGDLLKRKLDTRHSAGRDGARIRDRGYDLAEIDLTFALYETAHFDQLSQIVSALFPQSTDTTRRVAWPIVHPALAFAGVTEIYAKTLGALEGPDEQMRWTITVSCVQYRPEAQRSTAHRPRAAAAAPDLGANATAFDRTVERAPPTPPSATPATTAPTRT